MIYDATFGDDFRDASATAFREDGRGGAGERGGRGGVVPGRPPLTRGRCGRLVLIAARIGHTGRALVIPARLVITCHGQTRPRRNRISCQPDRGNRVATVDFCRDRPLPCAYWRLVCAYLCRAARTPRRTEFTPRPYASLRRLRSAARMRSFLLVSLFGVPRSSLLSSLDKRRYAPGAAGRATHSPWTCPAPEPGRAFLGRSAGDRSALAARTGQTWCE